MAVKVITRREPDADKPRRIDCKSCGSTLEYKPSEVRRESDFRDGDAHVVACPVCRTENWVEA